MIEVFGCFANFCIWVRMGCRIGQDGCKFLGITGNQFKGCS
jgi:hypothetical protein